MNFFPEIAAHRLANGLLVLAWEIHSLPIVSHQVHFAAGSRYERPGITGISHLFEHLMFKGTGRLKPEEFARIIQACGGTLNAFTTTDNTSYYENLPAEKLELAMDLEADRLAEFCRRVRESTDRAVFLNDWRICTGISIHGFDGLAIFPMRCLLEPDTVRRTCASWCSAISSRTACTCRMMSISATPTARAIASSAAVQGAAVPRTISDQAANERRGESSSGSSPSIGLCGLPAQVRVSNCSLRNHIR